MKHFWVGFEKRAGMLSDAASRVAGWGGRMVQQGMKVAPPGAGSLRQMAGKGLRTVGGAIQAHPRAAMGLAGGTAALGAGYAAGRMMGNQQQPAPRVMY